MAAFTRGLFCLPGVAFWLQRRLKVKGEHQRPWEWMQGRMFMLQKAKLEADGIGSWEVDDDGEAGLVEGHGGTEARKNMTSRASTV